MQDIATTVENCSYREKESARRRAFEEIWANDLDTVFAEVAEYYDQANKFASLGLVDRMRNRFVSSVDVKPNDKVLDVCAGANAIGIDLLKREPTLDVHAVERCVEFQEVGQRRAQEHGFGINASICDAHYLPFPDNHFDVATLEWAGRHLRLIEVFSEINRVLKPGGSFYHCDMLRPENKIVEQLYYLYLNSSIGFLAWAFRCAPDVRACRHYFIEAIRMFYSVDELSELLSELGYSDVAADSFMAGMMAIHRASKPQPATC